MKQRIYCPDIECDSCVKILSRLFKRLQGIESCEIKKTYLDVTFDDSLITVESIIQSIKDKGYRASLEPYTRKRIRDRTKEFLKDRKKYHIEYLMLRYIAITTLILSLASAGVIYGQGLQDPSFFSKYGWWIAYLTISVVGLGGAVFHYKTYKTQYTCMVGMMIGMTIGMQTGMMVGAVLGATNGFFIGAMVGMIAGSAIGAWCGKCCGIMGAMEGVMAGLMGGTMGPMITVMMFNENIFWFMPPYMILNLIVLVGLSYMIFEEVVEDNDGVIKNPPGFWKFFTWCTVAWIILMAIMVFAPASIFLR